MLENRVQGNDDGANPKHTVESDVSNRSLIVVIISRISGYDNQRVVKLGACNVITFLLQKNEGYPFLLIGKDSPTDCTKHHRYLQLHDYISPISL